MSRVSCFAVCCAALIATPVAAAPLSVHDLQLLNRVTWGADSAGAAEMQSLGAARWLDRQLHPAAADALPPQVRARIEAMSISTTPMADLARAMEEAHKALKDDVSPTRRGWPPPSRPTTPRPASSLPRPLSARCCATSIPRTSCASR